MRTVPATWAMAAAAAAVACSAPARAVRGRRDAVCAGRRGRGAVRRAAGSRAPSVRGEGGWGGVGGASVWGPRGVRGGGTALGAAGELAKGVAEEAIAEAESRNLAMALAKVASDAKGDDLAVLATSKLTMWTRYFVLVTAFSRPQIDAISKRMRDAARDQLGRVPRGGSKTASSSWVVLDFGDVVAHVFTPQERDHYDMDSLYASAESVALPDDFLQGRPLR